MTIIALTILLCLAALAGTPARGQTPARHWPETPRISTLNYQALKIRQARANRCLAPARFRWHPGYRVPAHMRGFVIRQRRDRLERTRALESRCIPWPWIAVADCESGDGDGLPPYRPDWSYNGSSGFDGGLQWLPSTWTAAKRLVDGASRYAYAWQAPAIVQVRVGQAWLAITSWAQWPACSARLGLR